jgi:hypothetical protein
MTSLRKLVVAWEEVEDSGIRVEIVETVEAEVRV